MRKLLILLNSMLKHGSPLARPDFDSRWSFLLTFKTVAFLEYSTLSLGAHTTPNSRVFYASDVSHFR